MNNLKASLLNKTIITALMQFVALLAIASIAPLAKNQFITGSIVNAALFASTIWLGVERGALIAAFPSLIALATGLLPPVLAPMIPFIITGNIIMISTFDYIRKINYSFAILASSLLKFIFLSASSYIVVNLITNSQIAQKVAVMMTWPQLITAICGGVIAYIVYKAGQK